ncbi:hypothetical protein [Xenorhabdus hominickii]|uniref:Uncharacterized protein n=1 Tax=Xenorhabdus hominickii TaxID=351679 RepID=A0A2G0Q1D2_XENHO|nr:hypothetical protein [Xenorhabdus hominickii]AOM40454.1 hypothetical protein A9255_07595 [Xenorhabdus hominickii]PHM53030.1 hypothetical protein Xhom_03913 [Xenorhabdus hominickii]
MIEILDVWGEGRIVVKKCQSVFCQDEIVTGFPNAININKFDQKISNGPNKGKDIPNLSPVNDYDYPVFDIPDNSYKYITLKGAPLTQGTANEILRVFCKEPNFGRIFFYDLDTISSNIFRGMTGDHFVVLYGRYKPSELGFPFNEITAEVVDVFFHK